MIVWCVYDVPLTFISTTHSTSGKSIFIYSLALFILYCKHDLPPVNLELLTNQ